jgi:hypothetical protein
VRAAAFALLLTTAAAHAQAAPEVGSSDFVLSSDLMAAGAEPFATSGTGQVLYGLRDGTDLYLCFLADTPELQAERQQVLVDWLAGEAEERTLPNIRVACILTQ